MKKFINALGTCAVIGALFMLSSCEDSYDRDELDRDIANKLNEKKAAEEAEYLAKTTDKIVLAGDTLNLPVRVTPQKAEVESETEESYNSQFRPSLGEVYSDDYYLCYFDPSDIDAIKKSLFEQTAALSEYSNFNWIEARGGKGHKYGESLKDFIAGSESLIEDEEWYFVDSNNVVKVIEFYQESDKSYFKISDHFSQIDEDGNVLAPQIGANSSPNYIIENTDGE